MKKAVVIVSALLLSSFGLASAETNTAKQTMSNKPIQSWTCEDFLDLNETYQPTAVGIVQFINEKKDTDNAYLDVDGIESVTPSLLTICKANPKTTLTKAVEQAKMAKK